jgi:hypothetical protein
MLKYIFKHFVQSSPLNCPMSEMLAFPSSPDSDRVLRKERNVVIPMLKTVFGQSSFSYRVAKRWNAL